MYHLVDIDGNRSDAYSSLTVFGDLEFLILEWC